MLGRLAGFFRAAPKTLPSFTTRLEALGYDFALIPSAFCDAITFELMNNPMMINNVPDYRIDASELHKYPYNPFADDNQVLKATVHVRLTQNIERFISQLEAIEALKKQWQDSKTTTANELFQECLLDPTQKKQLYIEQTHTLAATLLNQVNEFIQDTREVIDDIEKNILEPYLMLREDLEVKMRLYQATILFIKTQARFAAQREKIGDLLNARDNIVYLEKIKIELAASLQAMRDVMTTDGMNAPQIDASLAPQCAELEMIKEVLQTLESHTAIPCNGIATLSEQQTVLAENSLFFQPKVLWPHPGLDERLDLKWKIYC